jgi:glycosyltransferase involved in cell wall biosynthesis
MTVSRMRITYVLAGRNLTGGCRVIVACGNRLIERGHDVTLACLRWKVRPRPGALLRRAYTDARFLLGLDRDHVHNFKGPVVSSGLDDLPERLPDGDIVLATHWLTAGPVAALPASKGDKFYFLQGYEAPFFDAREVDATWRLAMHKIVVSTWLQELARDRFNDPAAVLVPNGVDRRLFDAPPRRPHQPPVVGVTYSGEKLKALPVAFEAARIARERVPGLQLVCVSAEKPVPGVRLPPGTRFYLRPPQRQLRAIYASADVWLCPSVMEGFGLPLLEAMACRCPVVSTRCGGPLDFVEDGINGHLVEVGDAQGMAARLADMLSDAGRWERMSEAAYSTSSGFNWERSVDLLETVLADEGRKAGRREGALHGAGWPRST